jgi:hypothetical protein
MQCRLTPRGGSARLDRIHLDDPSRGHGCLLSAYVKIVVPMIRITHAFASERGLRKSGNVNESSPNSQDAASHPRS